MVEQAIQYREPAAKVQQGYNDKTRNRQQKMEAHMCTIE